MRPDGSSRTRATCAAAQSLAVSPEVIRDTCERPGSGSHVAASHGSRRPHPPMCFSQTVDRALQRTLYGAASIRGGSAVCWLSLEPKRGPRGRPSPQNACWAAASQTQPLQTQIFTTPPFLSSALPCSLIRCPPWSEWLRHLSDSKEARMNNGLRF